MKIGLMTLPLFKIYIDRVRLKNLWHFKRKWTPLCNLKKLLTKLRQPPTPQEHKICFCIFYTYYSRSGEISVAYFMECERCGSVFSAFLRNFFLCQDHWHGDVPLHLAQPSCVALCRALDSGLIKNSSFFPCIKGKI